MGSGRPSDGVYTSQPQEKLLLFLYAKGLFAKESPKVRTVIFNALLHGANQVSVERLKRLTTIVNVGEKSPIRSTLDAKTFFDAFVELHPEWAPGEDHKGIVKKLVEETTDLTSLLKTNGPGLVSGFHLTSDFNSRQWHHEGYYGEAEVVRRLAMLLIGCREVGGKMRYLLQNWWKTKAMGGFLSNYEEMAECEIGLDASKNFVPEGMR
ncbi:hypothetical protein BJ741DRAFT_683485 [Chytriomyces cf. hyalinus JEL632]|nr:hypothetical protein BJ741DRAFT_683485 [Chytriomyces cf. hyalinus JEL632]